MQFNELSANEIILLCRVEHGAFDGATRIPSELRRLIGLGLVETAPITTLPIMPTHFRFTLSLLGKQLVASGSQSH